MEPPQISQWELIRIGPGKGSVSCPESKLIDLYGAQWDSPGTNPQKIHNTPTTKMSYENDTFNIATIYFNGQCAISLI